MKRALFWGSLIGAVIAFCFGNISWLLLPWQEQIFEPFKDEQEVASVLRKNAPKHALYLLPNAVKMGSLTKEQLAEESANWREKAKHGPIVFASIDPQGHPYRFGLKMFFHFVLLIIQAFIITFILIQSKASSYLRRCFLTLLVGFLMSLTFIPEWNFWHFPYTFTLYKMVDMTCMWGLSGLALAKLSTLTSKRRNS